MSFNRKLWPGLDKNSIWISTNGNNTKNKNGSFGSYALHFSIMCSANVWSFKLIAFIVWKPGWKIRGETIDRLMDKVTPALPPKTLLAVGITKQVKQFCLSPGTCIYLNVNYTVTNVRNITPMTIIFFQVQLHRAQNFK